MTKRTLLVLALLTGAAGIAILWAAGVDFPIAVPPGLVILLVGAAIVAGFRSTWADGVGGLSASSSPSASCSAGSTARGSRTSPATTARPSLSARRSSSWVWSPPRSPEPCWYGGVADRRTRLLLALSALLVLAGLFHLLVFAVDDRPWAGPVSWRKPFTFGISFGVTLATVVWVTSYLRLSERTRTVLLTVFALDCVVEVGGITLQAWRDVPSHLNRSTPFNTAVAITLAIGGAVLIVVLGRFAVAAIGGRADAPPSMRLALQAGFVLLVLGLLSGAAMIARGTVAMNTGTPTTPTPSPASSRSSTA